MRGFGSPRTGWPADDLTHTPGPEAGRSGRGDNPGDTDQYGNIPVQYQPENRGAGHKPE